jgi:hypothetical protein
VSTEVALSETTARERTDRAKLSTEARGLHKAKFRDSPFGVSVAALVAYKLRDHYDAGRNAGRLGTA